MSLLMFLLAILCMMQTLEDVFLQLCRMQDSELCEEVECTSPLVGLCHPHHVHIG